MIFEYYDFNKQLEKAIDIFNAAKSKSGYFKEKYKGLGEIKSYEDWLKIPFLSRDEIRNNAYPNTKAMLTVDIEDMIIVSTGGTSGVARFSSLTHDEWDKFAFVQANALKVLGVNKKDIVANLFVAGNMWPSFLGGHEIIKEIGAVHLPISAITDFDKLIYYFELFKPTVILSIPSLLIYFADTLLKKGKKFDSVRMIQFAGENLSDNARKLLKEAFGDVGLRAAGYSSADCGLMGYQCKRCAASEYHIPTDFQFIEIYDFEKDKPCDVGELGEVVVTNLGRISSPVIRYRIGDMGYIKKESCSCGDKNPLIVLKGRAGEDFKFGGAYVSMGQIEKCFSEFISKDGISANYQVIIDEIDDGKTSFILRIESSEPQNSKKYADLIKENLKNEIPLFKEAVDVEFIKVFEVEFVELGSSERSPITGKVKRLIDKRFGS
ncbi:phenylacetate--CoA ligase family protein [Hippea sp. KM1]|uniref:phenylacetate--CoA ligase family protein n=1 Tax=Hippea sp. KM1 TaxID=944481 RepID=UPI00046D64D0|nr:phenylacetate--CoA ligase family protein [Hippea sp. KM1]